MQYLREISYRKQSCGKGLLSNRKKIFSVPHILEVFLFLWEVWRSIKPFETCLWLGFWVCSQQSFKSTLLKYNWHRINACILCEEFIGFWQIIYTEKPLPKSRQRTSPSLPKFPKVPCQLASLLHTPVSPSPHSSTPTIPVPGKYWFVFYYYKWDFSPLWNFM